MLLIDSLESKDSHHTLNYIDCTIGRCTTNNMKDFAINDNIYSVGTRVRAKADPKVDLIIDSYQQRIYYCLPVDQLTQRPAAYFENELVAPAKS